MCSSDLLTCSLVRSYDSLGVRYVVVTVNTTSTCPGSETLLHPLIAFEKPGQEV